MELDITDILKEAHLDKGWAYWCVVGLILFIFAAVFVLLHYDKISDNYHRIKSDCGKGKKKEKNPPKQAVDNSHVNFINKKQEIRNLIADFKEEGKEDNIGNGFEFSDSISDIEKIREQRKNIHRYNAVKTEAELYLSILDTIVKEPCEKYRKEYEVILRPYVTKKRADCYYCYLFITDQFPELLKRKEELKQKGFFRLPPSNRATDMTDKELEHWGKNMRKHLLP